MEKKTSTKIKERKKKATATTELEESISHPPNHIIYRQNLPISWLPFKNPAILMISRANSQRVCFELKSPALLIKGGTCPADELLLYHAQKKKLSKPSPNHCRCSGLRIEFRLHLQPTPTSHPPRKFCR